MSADPVGFLVSFTKTRFYASKSTIQVDSVPRPPLDPPIPCTIHSLSLCILPISFVSHSLFYTGIDTTTTSSSTVSYFSIFHLFKFASTARA